MSQNDAKDCYLLALTGTPLEEIARLKEITFPQAQIHVEQEVWERTKPHEFDSLEDALDYLRLGRIQSGLWTSATGGGVAQTKQVLDLIEQRAQMKKGSETLTSRVRDMLSANNVDLNDEEQDDE